MHGVKDNFRTVTPCLQCHLIHSVIDKLNYIRFIIEKLDFVFNLLTILSH